ncbi:mesocentin-like [Vespula squamosa]|uniref:Mesocentin-like n=1 Tax=Vespula squamosa TaxID=30214 RepID=A0ABD2A442_VESSQ
MNIRRIEYSLIFITIAKYFDRVEAVTTNDEFESTTDDNVEVGPVPMTEEIMQHNISIVDIPDVDDVTRSPEPNWDAKEVIKDVAYFIRAHKFQDYDRRYYKSIAEVRSHLYEEFPNPTLRSIHWEVRKHCQASFVECLKYLGRIIKLTGLRREDDTVTIMKEQKWNLANNTEQILNVQRGCVEAQRQDNLTMRPFQGPIGKLRENFFLLKEFCQFVDIFPLFSKRNITYSYYNNT